MDDSRECTEDSNQVDGRQIRHCQPCKKKNREKTAVWLCKTCEQYQCSTCKKVHEDFDFMSGHALVQLVKDNSIVAVFDIGGLDMCKHHDKLFEFYCMDHLDLCCSSCAVFQHRGCSGITELSSENKKHSTFTNDLESDIQQLQETAHQMTKVLNETKAGTSAKLGTVLRYVEDIMNKLSIKFDELKAAMTSQFQPEEYKLMQKLDEDISKTKTITEDLKVKKEFLMSAKASGSTEQTFIVAHSIRKEITPYKATLQEQKDSLYELNCSVECNTTFLNLLDSEFNLASLQIDKTFVHSSNSQEDKTINLKKETIIPSEHSVKPLQLKLVTSVEVKQCQKDQFKPLYTGIDFFSDGRLAVVDNPNFKLFVMNSMLEKRGIYTFSAQRHDVCVLSDEELAVTSGSDYLIEFLHLSNTNHVSLTRIIKTTIQYVSISLINDTTFLVSTIGDRRPLRMITMEGDEKDFTNLPVEQHKLGTSKSTYIRNENIAALTDRNKHTVNLYYVGESGVTRRAVKHRDIKKPRGVSVGPNDVLFVCCDGTRSIVQVSTSGEVIGAQQLDIEFPSTICVSKNGKQLIVFNNAIENRKLLLFELL